jgi:hypothetical protein
MSVSLNTFVRVIVIATFIYILSWNFLSLKEGLSDDGSFDETTETIDSKTGQKREMTKQEAKDAKKKRAEEKSSSKDIDERIKYYNKTEAAS